MYIYQHTLYMNFEKRSIALELTKRGHAHLHITGIMCSKFYLDDLRTVGGVLDTTI